MKRLLAIGEALIDFIPEAPGPGGSPVFRQEAGGAPANVCAAAAKLGAPAALVTQLGADPFGDAILHTLSAAGVDTSLVRRTEEAHTALAFVTLGEEGQRDFTFYRKPCADLLLGPEQVEEEWFQDCGALHFGSVDLVPSPMRAAHLRAIALGAAAGALVSFDPNVRLPLWPSAETCREAILAFLPRCNLLKFSDEELPFLTGTATLEEAAPDLFRGEVGLVLLTRGKKGARAMTRRGVLASVPGTPCRAVDTTGAGDAFAGAFLAALLREGRGGADLEGLSAPALERYLAFAAAYAGVSVQAKGAIRSYPGLEEFRHLDPSGIL